MRILNCVFVFAALGGALVSCSDDESVPSGPADGTGGASDAGAPATTGGSTPTTGGTAPATGGAPEGGADSSTGGAPEGGADSTNGGAAEAGEGGSGGDVFPSSCGSLLGVSECDPVSGWPCEVESGETCDFLTMLGGYACFPAPNDAVFCAGCDPELDQFCGAGTTCNFDFLRCERYCCEDSDCASGTCLRDPFAVDDEDVARVGVCAEEAEVLCESGEGGASSGGAGGASSTPEAGSGGAE